MEVNQGPKPETGEAKGRFKSVRAQARELGRVRTRQTRLLVSIPTLMFTFTVLLAFIIRLNLIEIAADINTGETKTQIEFLANQVFIWMMGGAVAVLMVGFLLAWEILKPVKKILESMKRVTEGDLTQRADVSSFGEIESLGTAFNDMVSQLHTVFSRRDRQMREAASGCIITIDGYGKVLAADTSIYEIFGSNADQIVGHNLITFVYNLYDEDSREDFQDLLNEAITNARNHIATLETIEVAKMGEAEVVKISVKVTPLDSTELTSPTAIIDIRDLTTLKGFMENMQRADRLAAVGSLATGIAHEIRNPLGSIKGMTQLIEEDLIKVPPGLDKDGKPFERRKSTANHIDYLKRIRKESDRLDRLVSSIMDFARTEPGPTTTVDLNSLIREVYEQALSKAGLESEDLPEVSWEMDDQLPAIPLEENRLRQAYLNLIINSLEELREQTNGRLHFESFRDKTHKKRQMCFVISNTGNALPKEIRERIFEPFFTTKPDGTGLGLPIAYQIVIANNGVMEFDYKDGMVMVKTRFPLRGVEEEDIASKTSIPGITVSA